MKATQPGNHYLSKNCHKIEQAGVKLASKALSPAKVQHFKVFQPAAVLKCFQA